MLDDGTASALYFGQRLYQFPLGVFGVALGTVLFPLLAAHAQRGELDRVRDDLTLGLRLVAAIGIPASAGLMLLARPLASLCFEYGEFDADDARQTAQMIAAYGAGVWAYCGLLIVQRGYYAIGDRLTPVRVGLAAVAFNLLMNVALIGPFGGSGLALGTAITSMVQVLTVTILYQQRVGRLDWPALFRTVFKTLVGTALMSLACLFVGRQIEPLHLGRGASVLLPVTAAISTYCLAAWLLGLKEIGLLLRRDREGAVQS
jgi:putative peptidoglycan lipid II flippase